MLAVAASATITLDQLKKAAVANIADVSLHMIVPKAHERAVKRHVAIMTCEKMPPREGKHPRSPFPADPLDRPDRKRTPASPVPDDHARSSAAVGRLRLVLFVHPSLRDVGPAPKHRATCHGKSHLMRTSDAPSRAMAR